MSFPCQVSDAVARCVATHRGHVLRQSDVYAVELMPAQQRVNTDDREQEGIAGKLRQSIGIRHQLMEKIFHGMNVR